MPRGVRLNPEHDQRTRAKIQTSQILNRLMAHVEGKVELSPSQVRSAEILLRKTLPDLSSVEYSGPNGGPVQLQVSDAIDPEAWSRLYAAGDG